MGQNSSQPCFHSVFPLQFFHHHVLATHAWTRDPAQGPRPANARAETVEDKPSFRDRRCVLPADAFCEWRAGTPKQAFCIRAAQGGMLLD